MWWFQFLHKQQESSGVSERTVTAVYNDCEQTAFPLELYDPKESNVTLNSINEVLKLWNSLS